MYKKSIWVYIIKKSKNWFLNIKKIIAKIMSNLDLATLHLAIRYEKNVNDIYNRLNKIYNSEKYLINLDNPKVNWLDISTTIAITEVLDYILKL